MKVCLTCRVQGSWLVGVEWVGSLQIIKAKTWIVMHKQGEDYGERILLETRSNARQHEKLTIDNLGDGYIKTQLRLGGLNNEAINTYPELIEIKRGLLKTKRLLKQMQ